MKRIIYIILSILSFSLSAQTHLDSMLFNKINEYRISNGVNKIAWDTNIFKAANHQSTYLKLLNQDSINTRISHLQDVNFNDFSEKLEIIDRLNEYVDMKNKFYGENITGIVKKKNFSDEELVNIVFNNWKNSPEHNRIMLNSKYKYTACSMVVFVKQFYLTAKISTKSVELKKCFATIDFIN